jgi:uncharacterized tellurite resistance protein B-like protein
LVFLLHPLQRTAERFAQPAIPATQSLSALSHPERVSLLQDQANVAWSYGRLTRRERLLLSQLQARLGISHQEAFEAEARAAGRPT